jgi:hypothetical protein
MKKTFNMCALTALAGGAVLTAAPAARAAGVPVDCTMLTHPVYVAGSSAVAAYLEAIAPTLPGGINLIYASSASCVGIGDLITAGQTEPGSGFSQIDPTSGALNGCTGGANPYPAINVDIGVSDVYPVTCITPAVGTLPAAYKLWDGAIQAMEIAVPYGSSQNSISADAAYVVFGYAGQPYMSSTYAIDPWTIDTDIFTRGDTSGTQLMTATAIGLRGDKWLTPLTGTDAGTTQIIGSSGTMLTDIETAAALTAGPNPVIGILTNSKVDPNKSTGGVKPLAFQAKDQDCGYYPDSTKDTFDKINVRQGRYAIWGYEHFVTNVTAGNPVANPATGNPVASASADVATVIDILTHKGLTATSTPTLEAVVTAETAAYFIPQCAMQVSRTEEVGPEASYQPPVGCGCFYESQAHGGAGNLSAYCNTTACATNADCKVAAYPSCNFGFCEAQ